VHKLCHKTAYIYRHANIYFSENAKAIAMGNGILCTMFAMCLHFAFTMLEDEILANRTYAAIVFWHADSKTLFLERTQQFKEDFALLPLVC
jgi:hypothetical protein